MHCIVVFRFVCASVHITDDMGLHFKCGVLRPKSSLVILPNQRTWRVLVLRRVCLFTRHASEVIELDAPLIPLFFSGSSIHTCWALSACYLSLTVSYRALVGEYHSPNNETHAFLSRDLRTVS